MKKQEIKENAKKILLENYDIKPNETLLIFIKSVSRSGMSRRMKVIYKEWDITYYINELLGYSTKNDYVNVSGCGMDMSFWLADMISSNLWENGSKKFKGNGGSCIDWKAIY